MPSDTYSSILRLLQMADGNDNNTWGDNTNTNLNLLEQAIGKRADIAISSFTGNNYTLTTLNGSSDDARSIAIHLTGALSANVTVTFPNIPRLYVFDNEATNNYSPSNTSGFTVTCVTASAGGASAVVQAGQNAVYCDGNGDVYLVALPTAVIEQLTAYQQRSAGLAFLPVIITFGTNTVMDPSKSNNFQLTLTGNTTLQITASALGTQLDGQGVKLLLVQDSTGNRLVTWPTNVKWVNDTTPTLTATANGADLVSLEWRAAQSTWFATLQQGYNPSGAAGSSHTLVISQNCVDFNLKGWFAGLSGTPTINIIINPGVTVSASSCLYAALNLYDPSLPSGSTINVTNYGNIIGRAGRGGDCGWYAGDAQYGLYQAPQPGDQGGTAVVGPGSGYTFNFTNATGGIVGGGGGGGGGGGFSSGTTATAIGGGGGAGAGAFGNYGGRGKGIVNQAAPSSTPLVASDGQTTASGANSITGGTGGTAAGTTGGNGGNGGNLGTAGTAGGSPTGGATFTVAGGAAGAAGWAFNNNNVTFVENNSGTVYGSTYTGSGTQNWPQY